MGGQDHCCVVNCSNRRSSLPKGFAFHRIPAAPEDRRFSWIRATGRKIGNKKGELTVTDNTKVCGAHFVSGRKSDDPTQVDYIPTINLPFPCDTPKRNTENSKSVEQYSNAVQKGIAAKKKSLTKSRKVLFPADINDVQSEVEISEIVTPDEQILIDSDSDTCIPLDHDYHKFWVTPHVSAKFTATSSQTQIPDQKEKFSQTSAHTLCRSVQTENNCCSASVQVDTYDGGVTSNLTDIQLKQQQRLIKDLRNEVKELTVKKRKIQQQTFCAENLLTSDANVQFYTGLPNVATFNGLFSYLEPKAKKLTYWQGSIASSNVRSDVAKGPARKLTLKNEFFAVLVRLKVGLFGVDISSRFDISVSLFSKIFNTWIRFLSLELELLCPYPTADQVQEHLPESFSKFPNTRVIIDCTEVFVQKPSALKAQRETWSSYKHRNTFKSLVGITPDGTVSYVSDLYGGAATDKFIVNDCGFLNLIEPGDNVMADRGFDIHAELGQRGAYLNIPPFREGQFQLSSEKVETTRRIAEVRIHVERAIQRIKTFHILDGTLPLSLQAVAADIFKTCAFLTNFQSPIIKC